MPLEDPTPADKVARARAFHSDVLLANDLDNLGRMLVSAKAALALCQEGTDRLDLALSQLFLGLVSFRMNDNDSASQSLEESLVEFHALRQPYWERWGQHLLSLIHISEEKEGFSEVAVRDLEFTRRLGDRWMIARTLLENAAAAWSNDRLAEATAYVEEADRLFRQLGYKVPQSDWYGSIAHACKDYRRARQLYSESIEAWELLGDKNLKSDVVEFLAILSKDEGNLAEAQTHIEEALAIARELGSTPKMAIRLAWLGHLYDLQGSLEEAIKSFKESLLLFEKSSYHKSMKGHSLILTAGYLARHAPDLAVQILSAVYSLDARGKTYRARNPYYRGDFDEALVQARQALGESAFQTAWEEGKTLSIEEASERVIKMLEKTGIGRVNSG